MQKNYSAGQKSLLISIPKHRNASQQLAIYRGDYSNLFVVQIPKSKRGFGTVILHALQNMVSFYYTTLVIQQPHLQGKKKQNH